MEKQKFHLWPSTLILLLAGAIALLYQLVAHFWRWLPSSYS